MPLVVIAVATRRRPRMLGDLLSSWQALVLPAGFDYRFVIVENDTAPASRAIVEDATAGWSSPVTYALETEPGIPFARNRALDIALDLGARYLAFTDDDDVVAPDWIAHLLAGIVSSGAHLVGGPQRAGPLTAPVSPVQRYMHRGLVGIYDKKARIKAKKPPGKAEIVTNNCLADLDFLRAHGLRFDVSLRFTGGSDAKFDRDLKALGGRTLWIPEALVHETIPPDRLTPAYQFARAKSQRIENYHRKAQRIDRPPSLVRALPAMLGLIKGGLLMVSAVATGPARFVKGLHKAGSAAGHLSAARGTRSKLYGKIQGE